MRPAYRFAVRFRLDPRRVRVDPEEFHTTLYRPAPPPGEDGWLFFRDYLWKGAISDPEQFQAHASDLLGVPISNIEYTAFVTDSATWDQLRSTIADNLELFRADSVTAVVSQYFGSTVEVQSTPDDGHE